ncbi:MAG: hypothetical protein A2202_00625 [Bdellovibrionales bacterium RIFOXYA1_FULL_36_14]|nr:MAG: hypothetical protein A2202_00625 [Bdellovibrionales bacterium RIFOXYA1_FULL_36_14]
MIKLHNFTIILAIFFYGCASTVPRPKIDSLDNDLFRNESLTQYSIVNLELVKNKKNNAAIALCHNKKISEGLDLLKTSFAQQKNHPLYWLHVGTCYYLNDNFDKAKFFYNISLDTASKDELQKAFAYNNLGILYLKNNHILEARDYFEKSHKSNPDLITPRYNLGQIYIRYGLLTEALKLLAPLETQNPKSIELLSSLGVIHTLDNNSKQALNYFKRIPEPLRQREDIACAYALALYNLKDYASAKTVLSDRKSLGLKEMNQMASMLMDEIDNELKNIENLNNKVKKK